MSWYVGQVLYVAFKDARVEPVQVVKEVREVTLQGQTTTYMVRGEDTSRYVAVQDLDGTIFDTADAARAALTERASAHINTMVGNAQRRASELFGHVAPVGGPDEPADSTVATVVLPDGVSARVRVG